MMKKIKSLFTSKKKMFYDPSESDHKNAKKEDQERRESFKQLEFPDGEGNEISPPLEGSDETAEVTQNQEKTDTSALDEFEFITPIPEDRYNDVIVYLRNNFFADDLLNKSVCLCELGEPNAELEAFCLKTLAKQLSAMAVEKESNKIVAVAVNGILLPRDIEQERKELDNITDERFKQISSLHCDLNSSIDLFSKYDVDKICFSHILSVDSSYREKGLGKKISELCEGMAKKSGFKVFKADVTGLLAQKVFLLLGWECVHEMKFEDHIDEDGEQIFKPPSPNVSLKVMVKQVK